MGRAIIRAYLNLRTVPLSPATVAFDATRRAGMAMDLALRMRRHGRLSYGEVSQFATLAAVPESDLRLAVLPALESARMLEVHRRDDGTVVAVDELIGVARPVLAQASELWEAFGPNDVERCAIASSDLLSYAPLGISAHRETLERDGFDPSVHQGAFRILRSVGMLRSTRSHVLNEEVMYSPYVWGTEAVSIAEFMQQLPANERDVLATISRSVADRPGRTTDALAPSDQLVNAARKVGLIDTARVLTSGGTERTFAFSPALESQLGAGSTDVSHARKLFVAHILYGHRYGHGATGRIADPVLLVSRLIERGSVGPATAIRTDYPLLEARGIVRVREETSGRAHLELVQHDVASDGLELLRLALGNETRGTGASPIEALWVPGAFVTPEQDRANLAEIPAGNEADLVRSTIEELRVATARRMRGEDV